MHYSPVSFVTLCRIIVFIKAYRPTLALKRTILYVKSSYFHLWLNYFLLTCDLRSLLTTDILRSPATALAPLRGSRGGSPVSPSPVCFLPWEVEDRQLPCFIRFCKINSWFWTDPSLFSDRAWQNNLTQNLSWMDLTRDSPIRSAMELQGMMLGQHEEEVELVRSSHRTHHSAQ